MNFSVACAGTYTSVSSSQDNTREREYKLFVGPESSTTIRAAAETSNLSVIPTVASCVRQVIRGIMIARNISWIGQDKEHWMSRSVSTLAWTRQFPHLKLEMLGESVTAETPRAPLCQNYHSACSALCKQIREKSKKQTKPRGNGEYFRDSGQDSVLETGLYHQRLCSGQQVSRDEGRHQVAPCHAEERYGL